jgi:hypothetical protein
MSRWVSREIIYEAMAAMPSLVERSLVKLDGADSQSMVSQSGGRARGWCC